MRDFGFRIALETAAFEFGEVFGGEGDLVVGFEGVGFLVEGKVGNRS